MRWYEDDYFNSSIKMDLSKIKKTATDLISCGYCDFYSNKNMAVKALKKYRRPSYIKAMLLLMLWYNSHRPEWVEVSIEHDEDENLFEDTVFYERDWQTPPTSFCYEYWQKACKKAGLAKNLIY